ncbi:MAG TPA: glycosyltransferase [Acidobacteriaceae bacterium]|jgi:succinoglycan biosynthesis protein ExoA|nr:glycosyltransferase [Acidobacteriaceae bacterium]
MNIAPFISVILPVRNEEATLPALLSQLCAQDYPKECFEVLIVDGRSTDRTRELVQRIADTTDVRISLIDNPKIRSGPGRNCGIHAAKGQYIVFIDGHTYIPSRTLLADTIKIFQETGAACLCRPQPLIAKEETFWQSEIAAVRATPLGHGRGSLIYDMTYTGFVDPASSGASYAAWVFDQVGLYDEAFDACEDVELNVRVAKAGLQAYTDPRLAIFYEARKSLSSFSKQLIRYGRGRVRLARKHPDTFGIGTAVPLAILGTVLLACIPLLQAIFGRHAVWALVIPLGLYLSVICFSTLALARKRGLISLPTAPAIYLCLHLSLAFGMIRELFSEPRATRTGSSCVFSEADRT